MSDGKIDQRLMIVVNSTKQAIERGVNPGLSVNRHPNAFFLHVNGEIDLKSIAEVVLQRLDAYDEYAEQVRIRDRMRALEPALDAANDPWIL